ncbi:MAG TPA: acyl-CoA synthetase [Amycolatopsis sp.]|uniref:acyl-CoA synthetase n=1 Tax=Amycolatopsis sp. TaxID=37632 RepID=UPI002B45C134|nr:acyl-CoA synthetase [Amycolatopsis sp.]HKS47477.1 acyl-CoA synthetase [Amycolatopsis sp.]
MTGSTRPTSPTSPVRSVRPICREETPAGPAVEDRTTERERRARAGQAVAELTEPAGIAAAEEVPLDQRHLPSSTYDLLVSSAERFGAAPAFHVLPTHGDFRAPHTITYRELLERVHQVANLLSGQGVRRHHTVSLLLPNVPEICELLWGAQAAATANPVNPQLAEDHMVDILRRAASRVLVAPGPDQDPDLWRKALRVAAAVPTVRTLLVVGGEDRLPAVDGLEVLPLTAARALPSDRLTGEDRPGPQDIAALIHTGGTTGAPKLAAHTHRNQVYMAWAMALVFRYRQGGTLLCGMPFFHVNAILITGLAPVLSGAPVVSLGEAGFRDARYRQQFWRIVEHYRVTAFSAVPTVCSMLTEVPVDADISSLELVLVGASTLPDGVRTAFEKHAGVPLCEGWGMTEGTCGSTYTPRGDRRPGSVGLRMPYQRIKVARLDSAGTPVEDLPPGVTGTVLVSGPNVFPGYVRDAADGRLRLDSTGKVFDGWLETGDLGRLDDDGYLWLRGRAKDVIIRGGHNIDPTLIEQALDGHPDVVTSAAVGRPDRHAGEVPVAFVTLRTGATVNAEELCAYAARHVGEPTAAPKEIHILDELPLTAVGKIFKPALRREAMHRVVLTELRSLGITAEVTIRQEDGLDVAEVVLKTPGADAAGVERALNAHTFPSRVVPAPPV